MSRTIRITCAVALAGLALASCGKDATKPPLATPTLPTVSIGGCQTSQGAQQPAAPKGADFKTQLKEPGVLNIGSDNDFGKFETIPAGAKEPVGFDVDLYKEVAKRMGLTAKSTTTDFDALFTTSVPNGTFDLGVSAITIKDERKQTVDFTVPYFEADLSLAVNTKRTPEITTIDNLAGKTIGAQDATTGKDCADLLVKDGKAKEVRAYKNAGDAFRDLVAGRVAAVVNDRPASEGFIESNPDLRVTQIIETREQYGFAISKNKPDLREEVNKQLLAIMNDGTFATIYERWFETKPPFTVPLT